ncbi:helix-turn-helix domain-containing protein [Agromyces badenianii]|uniref:helix-turn-helix domain-containing protein n=1 Tax=Agromyces badenianii TaxID=2080742 RepID=UPI0014050D8A|nr:helix-turn-helix transcriptional regulator [Agromyces badenianii]
MAQLDKPDKPETIGKRIAKYRKLEGWSAQKLADAAELTRSVVTNIENGRRPDVTVSELLAISIALRVPPAALLFDVERPFHPAKGEPTDTEDGESDDDNREWFQARTIDVVDWLNSTDTSAEADPELAEFNEDLEDLDAIVVYPVGLSVHATYGKAGRRARALLNAARTLERTSVRYDRARRNLRLFEREAWDFRAHRDEDDQAEEAMSTGTISKSKIGQALIEATPEEDRDIVARLMRDSDAAHANYQDALAQFRLLGGDPSRSRYAMSPHQVMDIVHSMPHERRSLTEQRGSLAEGVVESPLRRYRDDELDEIRQRARGPWLADRDSGA